MALRRIIDKRRKEKYMLDDEYLNGMARLCGWHGTIVYNSLCRHVNKEQTCFPSIKLMSEQHNVDRKTIMKGIKALKDKCIITTKRVKRKNGRWLNNEYILLDKSEWLYNQVHCRDINTQVHKKNIPSPCNKHDIVPNKDSKETHKKGNKYKETHSTQKEKTDIIKFTPKDIQMTELLINLIQHNNPEWNFKGNKDNWAEHINKLYRVDGRSYDQIEFMIKWVQKDSFWSQNILSTSKLRDKFNDLIPRVKGGAKKDPLKDVVW